VRERNFAHTPRVPTSAYFCKHLAHSGGEGKSGEPDPAAHGVSTSGTSLATA